MNTALWMMKKHVSEEREEEGQGVGSTVLLVSLCNGGSRVLSHLRREGERERKEGRGKEREGERGRVRRRVNGE